MSAPYFTVAIPTKNRPDLVANAIASVLRQTFTDLEVIVCDNGDEASAAETEAVAGSFGDPRIRYVRTSGRLSMPDNWERAIADAAGEFVGILTDRSVLRRDALQLVRREIEGSGAAVVTWLNDLYGTGPSRTDFKRRACSLERYRHGSEELLAYFVHGNPVYSTKIVPKLMTSVCHRSILHAIRQSAVGRCCPPVAPDFTSGFLILAHSDWVLTIDDALYVSCGTGTGADFRRGGEMAARFRRDLGMESHEIVDRMPSDACFSHALVLNDLMRVRDAIPQLLPHVEVDKAQYYLGCLNDYVKASYGGTRRDEELALLLEALEHEPAEVRDIVKRTRLYLTATRAGRVTSRLKARLGAIAATGGAPEFDTVFDAMAWDESNPREPAATSFVSLEYGLDQLYPELRPPARI